MKYKDAVKKLPKEKEVFTQEDFHNFSKDKQKEAAKHVEKREKARKESSISYNVAKVGLGILLFDAGAGAALYVCDKVDPALVSCGVAMATSLVMNVAASYSSNQVKKEFAEQKELLKIKADNQKNEGK